MYSWESYYTIGIKKKKMNLLIKKKLKNFSPVFQLFHKHTVRYTAGVWMSVPSAVPDIIIIGSTGKNFTKKLLCVKQRQVFFYSTADFSINEQ